eukprot:207673-Rhodomonas_salina.2
MLAVRVNNPLSGKSTTVVNVYMPQRWDDHDRRKRQRVMRRLNRIGGKVVAGGDWNVAWGYRSTASDGVRTTRSRDLAFQRQLPEEWKVVTDPWNQPTWVAAAAQQRRTACLDFWMLKEMSGASRTHDMAAGFDHKRITLSLTLNHISAPSVMKNVHTRTQPDMRRWAERKEDWLRALPPCEAEPNEEECRRAVVTMVEEAARIGGLKVMGAGRKQHQSREQNQLRADAATLRKCEEEWWMRGRLSVKNCAKLAQFSKWPGLLGVEQGDLGGVTYNQGAKLIAEARKDREEKEKQTLREQQRAEARLWLKQALKDFPGAGTYNAGINTSKGQFPQAVLQDQDTVCTTLMPYEGMATPLVLCHEDEAKGVLAVTFRDPDMIWPVMQDALGLPIRVKKVMDADTTTPNERKASWEAFMGRNATAAYKKCRACKEAGLDHELTHVTEDGEERTLHAVCARCCSTDLFTAELPAPPYPEEVFTEEVSIDPDRHTPLQGTLTWSQFMRLQHRMTAGKSPGVDGFTVEMLRSARRDYLNALFRLINMYLIPTGKRTPGTPAASPSETGHEVAMPGWADSWSQRPPRCAYQHTSPASRLHSIPGPGQSNCKRLCDA